MTIETQPTPGTVTLASPYLNCSLGPDGDGMLTGVGIAEGNSLLLLGLGRGSCWWGRLATACLLRGVNDIL